MTIFKDNTCSEFCSNDWIHVVVFNTVIALFLTAIGFGGGLVTNLIFSQCIGLANTVAIRASLKHTREYSLLVQLGGLITAMLLGILVGAGGALLITKVFSINTIGHGGRHTVLATLVISILFASIITYIFLTRERLKAMHVDAREKEIIQERKITETTLRLLQAQIEPHFLFNTLATVISQIGHNSEEAKKTLLDLDRYLRTSLSRTRSEATTLAQEIELVTAYLDILKVRMGERLRYSIEITDDILAHPLPPLLIQPLVENSIRHGLEPSKQGGEIVISGKRYKKHLILKVSDTGLGMKSESLNGVGLTNIRERLLSLYGEAGTLSISENSPSGITATIEIPYAAH